jgi:hypothetical protein
MRWTLFSVAGALSFSGNSVAGSALKAQLNAHPDVHLYGSSEVDAVAHSFEKRNVTSSNLLSRSYHRLFARQGNVGRCGADFGSQVCGGSQCCSSYGYCGTEFEVNRIARTYKSSILTVVL